MVIWLVAGTKLAVSVVAAAGMVKIVLDDVVEKMVPPVEVQLLKTKPELAKAEIGMLSPEG
jgi:hypothetical protein